MVMVRPWYHRVGSTIAIVLLLGYTVVSNTPAPYEIRFEGVETKNGDLGKVDYIRLAKFNSTTAILNTSVYVKYLPDDAMISLNAFERKGNGFSVMPLPLGSMKMCQFMEAPGLMYEDVAKAGNLPLKCPWTPGQYFVNNYRPDLSRLPPQLPGERWRIDVVLTSKAKTIFKISVFVWIKRA